MHRTSANTFIGFRKPAVGAAPKKSEFIRDNRLMRDKMVKNLPARFVAIAIFLYFFVEHGTLGLFPEKYYVIYRSMRISDIILYLLVIYSLFNIREFLDFFNSRSFMITKILLGYFALEFLFSFVRYRFDPIEYVFRLKGLWSSFLVLPYLLLYKRGGLPFLIKLVFPVAIISNVLYVLTALTGITFLPDVSMITQILPGGITVYRVYGGTFFGEFFFLGLVYFWITKKFRLWQLSLVLLFMTPHILAFGRTAWAYFLFAMIFFAVINAFKKQNYKLLFRHVALFILIGGAFLGSFIAIIPDSTYYFDALTARFTQGENDVTYSEGSYGTRVIFQNNALVGLWLKSDLLLGVGMHPMWVVKPESYEEQVLYNAFCDVQWPATLAAYGGIGFAIALIFQIYYMVICWKIVRKAREPSILSFIVTVFLSKLVFDTFINFTYFFLSVGLWGLTTPMNFFVATIVYYYEMQKEKDIANSNETKLIKNPEAAR